MGAPSDWQRYLNSSSTSPVKALAASVYWGTRKSYPMIWIGRGWDTHTMSGSYPSSGQWPDEHGTGRALDIICTSEVGIRSSGVYREAGDAIVAWIMSNARQMHVRHIIWQNMIWKTRYGSWGTLGGNRGGVSDRHEDHIHVFFEDTYGSIPELNFNSRSEEDELEMNQETKNEISSIVAREIWDTSVSGVGRFYDAFREVALRLRELGSDLGDVRRADGYYAINQEIADTKTKVNELESKLDKLSTGVEAILERLDRQ